MNKKRIIFIVSLILLLILGAIFLAVELFRPKTATTVGEIVYITQFGQEYGEELNDGDSLFVFYVYIKPLGKTENDDWILFTVDKDTETESQKNSDISKMPELSVGTVVEIVHNADIEKPGKKSAALVYGYFAESIKAYKGDTASLEGQEIPLKLNKKYSFDNVDEKLFEVYGGEIVGIVKVKAPISGYIIYVHHDTGFTPQYILGKYWVDDKTIMDDELRAMIKSGVTGAKILEGSTKSVLNPFTGENEDVVAIYRLLFDSNEAERTSTLAKWESMVVDNGAKTVCIKKCWTPSSVIFDTKIVDESDNAEFIDLFEGITLSKSDEEYTYGLQVTYLIYLSGVDAAFDESGNMSIGDWENVTEKGITLYVDSDGYVRVGINLNGFTADEWYKSNSPVDVAKIVEYYEQATTFKTVESE